eukprot:g3178.t1
MALLISASIASEFPYKGLEQVCSDVMNARADFPKDDKLRAHQILNRLKRKGIIGQRAQKKPATLRHVNIFRTKTIAQSYAQIRTNLLIGFYGAFRRKEAAAMTFLEKGEEVPRGYIGVRLCDVDKSVHFDLTRFIQKGGPRSARHVRAHCACEGNEKRRHLCLVCSEANRSAIKNIHAGFDLGKAVEVLRSSLKTLSDPMAEELDDSASHSCRIGLAIHLFENEEQMAQIVHHARWADETMVLYYARNSKGFARPAHWTNGLKFLKASKSEDYGEDPPDFELDSEDEDEEAVFHSMDEPEAD